MLRKLNFRSGPCRQLGSNIKDVFTGHYRLMSTSNLQVMIFGSSTGVGKTIVSAGVCRAALAKERKVCYIKPLQTGELDEYFVNFYTNPQGICDIFLRTLHHWSSSMPPHLAAAAEANPISDKDLVVGLEREMRAFSNGAAAQVGTKQPQLFTVIETAGGVLSPGPSRNLQADIYRTFRFPIILVGDSKLGGITTTLSAYESLRLRGYTVHAIVMIEHPGTNKYGNVVMIREHLQRSLSSTPMSHTTGDSEYNNMPPWAVNSVPKVFRMFPLPSDKLLHHWFKENADEFTALFDHIEAAVEEEKKRLLNMRKVGQENIWWPFTQHASVGDDNVTFIESAHGDKFRVITPVADTSELGVAPDEIATKDNSEINVVTSDLFDGCGSWWTQGVGHGNPSMSLALAEAAGRYGHVMFPSNLHPPAVQLAQYLLEKGPGKGWANRVFYSDDGSTGMEVAIKMALRLWDVRVRSGLVKNQSAIGESDDIGQYMHDVIVLTQKDCYHGDTLGTMDTAEKGPFNQSQHPWYRPRTLALPLPLIAYRNGRLTIDASEMASGCAVRCTSSAGCKCLDIARTATSTGPWGSIDSVMNVKSRSGSALEDSYQQYIDMLLERCDARGEKIGAFLLEPLMLGAGGLKFVDPLFQKVVVRACRSRGIPIVYDEVAVGMYRLGPSSTASILGEVPDIAVYGKLLSGGYVPLAATLATTETFNAFLGKKKWHALLHGHSFTANPIACASSLESIRLVEGGSNNTWFDPNAYGGLGGVKPSFSESEIREVSLLPGVKGVMSLGSVLSVELRNSSASVGTLERPPVEFQDPEPEEGPTENSPLPEAVTEGTDFIASKHARYYNNNASAVVVSLLKQNNVYARPLGNVVYLMPTPLTPEADRQRLIRVIKRCITKAFYLRQPSVGGNGEPYADMEAGPNTIV